MNTTANLQQNFENIQLEFDPNKVLFSPNNEGVIVYEEFKDIPGYEGMYQVSNFGRAKSLNRMIKPCGHKVVVDHKDNIRTNNFFWNLQLISQRENSSKDKKGYSSDCTGVSRCAETKKFQAFIQVNGKNTYLGTFTDEVEASEYYKYSLKRLDENKNIIVKRPFFYSKHKGISFDKKGKKWTSTIRSGENIIHIGRFNTEQEAYEAREKALS